MRCSWTLVGSREFLMRAPWKFHGSLMSEAQECTLNQPDPPIITYNSAPEKSPQALHAINKLHDAR